MKEKIIGIMICALLVSSVLVGASVITNNFDKNNGIITANITIDSYEIETTENGVEISIDEFGHLLIPGKPNLPTRIFSIAIPPGAVVDEVRFEIIDKIELQGYYNVAPVSLPGVIGEEKPEIKMQEQLTYEENYESVYFSDDPYPASPVEFVRTSGFRKYNLVDVRINPFTYLPQSGQLIFYSEIDVFVSYNIPKDFSNEDIMIDNVADMEKRAEEFIFNYDQAKTWYPTAPLNRESYDYVIITIESLTSYVSDLKDWEETKGKSVNVVTTSWISSNYDGYDLQEKMRNFLREKYPSSEWGIEDVCLIGHYDDVPMRRCEQNTGYGKPETDFYYAELTYPDSQSWDQDGDHKYGENSDPIDFYAEVNVGRIPWSETSTVDSICDKSAAYEQNSDPSFKKNILLLGAFFWSDTDNAVLMEEKIDQSWMGSWSKTRMYEQGQSTYPMDYNLDYNNVKNVWSSGKFGFVNWAGHGSPTACYEYYPSQAFVNTATCNSLNDNYPSIVFADACSNSDTDHLNIGQAMLKKGAVGFLGATKVAYGKHAWDDPLDGSSQSFDYYFTIRTTSGDYTQGEAHQMALTEMYTKDLWYYLKYETFEWGALWGNPDLGMIYVPQENLPPLQPSNPHPWDGEVDVDVDENLTWSCSDPNFDPLTYDVYFGESSNPPLVSSGQDEKEYDPGTMEQGETYYWKINAEDDEGASTMGPTWKFTVWENSIPNYPENPNPPDDAEDVDVNVVLSWTCTDPDYDPLTFDVYFEPNDGTPDELVSENQTETTYYPGTLDYYTHYYWRIFAWDSSGAVRYGYIWDFETGGEPNNPPNAPENPYPADGATVMNVEVDLSWSCSDPDGDDLMYDVYFEAENPNPEELVSNDQTSTTFDPGELNTQTTYYWQIIAIDEHGALCPGPIWHFTTHEEINYPPETPSIDGPTNLKINEEGTFTVTTVDPEGEQVYYQVDWGDGSINWDGPYNSGEVVTYKHMWITEDTFTVRVKAKDTNDAESGWGELQVIVPRTRMKYNFIFNSFFARFSHLFPILKATLLLLK
jgi:hypothetical protein